MHTTSLSLHSISAITKGISKLLHKIALCDVYPPLLAITPIILSLLLIKYEGNKLSVYKI